MHTWPCARWTAQLDGLLPGVQVQVVDETGSTNSDLMSRFRAGLKHPVVLVALRQTAGRGRAGRSWTGEPGAALTFSLGLPLAPQDWSGLSLAVGVTLARALHPDLRIKWPNDLWWQQRKLAGILIETAHVGQQRFAVIGVGINVQMPAAQDLATTPAALSEIVPGLDPIATLDQLLLPLARALRQFEAQGFAPFADEFARLDGLQGRPVRLSDGTQGVAAGVGAQGALLVHTDAKILEVTSSEVSVRPV